MVASFAQTVPFAVWNKKSTSCVSGTQTYNAVGGGSFTVPSGCTSITIEIWGGGGGGANGTFSSTGGGGGGGAYASKTRVATPGEVISYTIGGAGAIGSAGAATLADGMTANGGNGASGTTNGSGGSATGGDINTNGANGLAGAGGAGANGGAGGIAGVFPLVFPSIGTVPGGGGGGGMSFSGTGAIGAAGQIRFTY